MTYLFKGNRLPRYIFLARSYVADKEKVSTLLSLCIIAVVNNDTTRSQESFGFLIMSSESSGPLCLVARR